VVRKEKGNNMLTVNFQSRTPVYQQLYDDVVRLVSLGVLKSNTKLPPVRTLAAELGINPNTVSKAYKMLEADGYIYSTVGRGSFISDQLGQKEAAKIQVEQDLKKSVEQAYKHGVLKEEVLEIVRQIYEEAE
jgi:GntR family transcriptional regulator